MPSIEQAIRTMLTSRISTGVADDQITHAYRLQDSPLPAVTFEVTNQKLVATSGLQSASLAINCIAPFTIDAVDLADTVKAAAVKGTYSSVVIREFVLEDTTVNPPISGMSDEQEPATVIINYTVYWG
jgi:hypothetical protein